MHDRSVLVTGCSSGIGRCVSLGLKERGYRVFATARRPEDLQQLEQAGLEAIELHLDDPASVANAADKVLSASWRACLWPVQQWRPTASPGQSKTSAGRCWRNNCVPTCSAGTNSPADSSPACARRGEGRIIQNSSVLGLVAMPYRGAYNCSKFALEGLSRHPAPGTPRQRHLGKS